MNRIPISPRNDKFPTYWFSTVGFVVCLICRIFVSDSRVIERFSAKWTCFGGEARIGKSVKTCSMYILLTAWHTPDRFTKMMLPKVYLFWWRYPKISKTNPAFEVFGLTFHIIDSFTLDFLCLLCFISRMLYVEDGIGSKNVELSRLYSFVIVHFAWANVKLKFLQDWLRSTFAGGPFTYCVGTVQKLRSQLCS